MKRLIFALLMLLVSVNARADIFGSSGSADDTAYSITWDNSTKAPTQNAVYDKIESLGGGGFDSTAIDSPTWSDGTQSSLVHTFNVSSGTDPTITFTNALVTFNTAVSSGVSLSAGTIFGNYFYSYSGNDIVFANSGNLTFGYGDTATKLVTFSLSGATDPTLTAANNALTSNVPFYAPILVASGTGASTITGNLTVNGTIYATGDATW
jgi:hypothetical protein